jgi:hypothetical protein
MGNEKNGWIETREFEEIVLTSTGTETIVPVSESTARISRLSTASA